MITQKVTRDEIRAIKVGQTGIFTLPTLKAVQSARVQFYTVGRFDGIEFEKVQTNDPLTIAFKRVK